MSKYVVDGTDLTSIADAIRAKTGSEAPIVFPTGFVSEISKTQQIKVEYVEKTNQTIIVYLPTGTYQTNQIYTFNIFANSITSGLSVESLAIIYVNNTIASGDIKNSNGETVSTCNFGVYKDSGDLEIGSFSTAFTINEPNTIYAVLPYITYKGYAANLQY